MTRAEFLAALKQLHIRQADFALIVGLKPDSVYHWSDLTIPGWVPVLLAAWSRLAAYEATARSSIEAPLSRSLRRPASHITGAVDAHHASKGHDV